MRRRWIYSSIDKMEHYIGMKANENRATCLKEDT